MLRLVQSKKKVVRAEAAQLGVHSNRSKAHVSRVCAHRRFDVCWYFSNRERVSECNTKNPRENQSQRASTRNILYDFWWMLFTNPARTHRVWTDWLLLFRVSGAV